MDEIPPRFRAAFVFDGEEHLTAEQFLRDWTIDDTRQMVYEQSDTDMLVAMPLPLTDLYADGLSPWEECAELAAKRKILGENLLRLHGMDVADARTRRGSRVTSS